MARSRSMIRGSLLAVVAVLMMAACGGDDDDAASEQTAPSDAVTAPTDDGGADDGESEEGGTGPGGLAAGTARVTIGGTTWEGVADQCLDFGVALGFQGSATDDPEIGINLDANTDDPSANSADVDLGDEGFWRAGPEYVSLGATIPEVTAEDGYGTGTATFADVSTADGVTAEGTYEFYCG
jgi:hypothetical protein